MRKYTCLPVKSCPHYQPTKTRRRKPKPHPRLYINKIQRLRKFCQLEIWNLFEIHDPFYEETVWFYISFPQIRGSSFSSSQTLPCHLVRHWQIVVKTLSRLCWNWGIIAIIFSNAIYVTCQKKKNCGIYYGGLDENYPTYT